MLQLPWPTPCDGLVLVVDLWSGIAGLLVALLSLGIRFVAVSAEVDRRLVEATAANLPNVVHAERVEDVDSSVFQQVLARRKFSAIVVGWGPTVPGELCLEPRTPRGGGPEDAGGQAHR